MSDNASMDVSGDKAVLLQQEISKLQVGAHPMMPRTSCDLELLLVV